MAFRWKYLYSNNTRSDRNYVHSGCSRCIYYMLGTISRTKASSDLRPAWRRDVYGCGPALHGAHLCKRCPVLSFSDYQSYTLQHHVASISKGIQGKCVLVYFLLLHIWKNRIFLHIMVNDESGDQNELSDIFRSVECEKTAHLISCSIFVNNY